MSKPWFLKMALEAEPTPLAKQIADVLKTSKSEVKTDAGALAEGISSSVQVEKKQPDAPDEVA